MMQETKLKPNEKISCASLDDFQVFYLNRQTSQGGGIALGVNKDYDSTLIKEGNDETEAIAVKIFLKEMEVRTVCAYGPQETASKDKKVLGVLRGRGYQCRVRRGWSHYTNGWKFTCWIVSCEK